MVDTNCEYRSSSISVNLSELWTIDPMMPALLEIDELDDTWDSSGDNIYHQVDSSDDDMDISDGDTDIMTQ